MAWQCTTASRETRTGNSATVGTLEIGEQTAQKLPSEVINSARTMASEAQRRRALEDIRENIARHGLHVYLVMADVTPRFAYTIGLSESVGAELILAGAIFYMKDDVLQIIKAIASQWKADPTRRTFEVTGQGSFSLREAHGSWAAEFIPGAFDYYQRRDIPALRHFYEIIASSTAFRNLVGGK